MNPKETVQALLVVEAQAKALDARKAELRNQLDEHLRSVWENDGIVSTLKAPGLGTVSLAGCDSTSLEVVDPDAYLQWAKENHPDLVRVVTIVESSLLTALGKSGAVDPDGRLITDEGELVPGIEAVARRPYLRVALDREAKARAIAELERLEQPVEVSS